MDKKRGKKVIQVRERETERGGAEGRLGGYKALRGE